MSGTARDQLRKSLLDFLGDPKTFMASNIVLPPGSPLAGWDINPDSGHQFQVKANGSGLFQFSFEKVTKTGKRGNNEDCPIFSIGTPDKYTDAPRFNAYYCHYDTEETFDLMLSPGGDVHLMLTPKMDGCSFGVGSETSSGGRRVAHANVSRTASTPEGIKEQGVTQASNLGKVIDKPKIIGPEDYVGPDVAGTTVGVWGGGHWSFFMQVWKRPTSTDYILDKIIDIA
jgi:hypothetical protein